MVLRDLMVIVAVLAATGCASKAAAPASCGDARNDAANCGACGHACVPPANGTAACANGACAGLCAAGKILCGGGANGGGACVDTTTDANHCGSCAAACTAPAGGTVGCVGSACTDTCATGQTACGAGTTGGGTCVDLSHDVSACGACGQVCLAPSGGAAGCSGGACLGSCPAGQVVCGGAADGGGTCVDLAADAANCGACGHVCLAPTGGAAGCFHGGCAGSCSGGATLCGAGTDGGGACADTATDAGHCGSCGHPCVAPIGGTAGCSSGACVDVCTGGQAACGAGPNGGGTCVDLSGDAANCGACGHACAAPTGGASGCVAGNCVDVCTGGQTACGAGVDGGGSCVDTQVDPVNCASCGHSCAAPTGGNAGCVVSTCAGSCGAGEVVCGSGVDGGGVCTNTMTDPSHCGSCGGVCSPANAVPSCSGGACKVASCSLGFLDCDHAPANGCECAGTMCCGSNCSTSHSNGLGQNFYDCNPLATYVAAQAIEACTAYAISLGESAARCTDGWLCGASGATLVCHTDVAGTSCGSYCWQYSGAGAGAVEACSACNARVGTWR